MAKNSQSSKGHTGKTSVGSGSPKRSSIGDSKKSMEILRKAAEIPPKTGTVSSGSKKSNS